MTTSVTLKQIKKQIADLEHTYSKKYGNGIFAVEAKVSDDILALGGTVISGKQHLVVLTSLKALWSGEIRDDISILARGDGIGWFNVEQNTLDLWNRPIAATGRKSKLSTQACLDEWVKVLWQEGDETLVQCEDGAIGWTKLKLKVQGSKFKATSGAVSYWQRRKAEKDKLVRIKKGKHFGPIARTYLDVPYRLGGRTKRGLDCSALTQLVYLDCYDLLLPRHSWDQKECGREVKGKVKSEKLKEGDLVFGLAKRGKHKHVGIFLHDGTILHASRRQKKVVIWERELFEKIYDVVVCRRIVELPASVYQLLKLNR